MALAFQVIGIHITFKWATLIIAVAFRAVFWVINPAVV